MKKQLLYAFGAVALLASCSSDMESPVADINDGYLKVNATINEVKSRVTGTDWGLNDQIGVTGGSASNVLFSYNGGFTATDPIKVTGPTTFSAYYPYSDNTGDVSFKVVDDQNAPLSDQGSVDFMFAEGVQVTKDNPTANFTFKHKMSQLKLTVEDVDNQFEDATVSLSIKDATVDGTFNTTTGVVTLGATKTTVKVGTITFGQPKIIILPSFSTNNTTALTAIVEVVKDDNTSTYTAEITPDFAAGNQYGYKLSIKANNPDLGVGGTITDWEKNEEGEIDMEEKEPEYELAPGDFLLKDGKTIAPSSYTNQDVVGVVFYVGDAGVSGYTKGLAIALKNAQTEATRFYTSNTFLTGLYGDDGSESPLFSTSQNTLPTEIHGYSNTQLIKDGDGLNLKGLLSSFNSDNEVTGASTWYLPSYAEFEELSKVISTVQTSLTKADGSLEAYTTFTGSEQNNNFYWTSDFFSATYNWAHPLGATEAAAKDHRVSAGNNSKNGFFRFAIAF